MINTIPKGKDCWSCHWCWLGRCMHGVNYGRDVSDITECEAYIDKLDYARLKKPMTCNRAKELLEILIKDLLKTNDNAVTTAKHLLQIGFTSDELVIDFNFSEDDVEKARQDDIDKVLKVLLED